MDLTDVPHAPPAPGRYTPGAMDVGRALEKLRKARRRIIEVAAAWQAEGVDTEPLNLPLIEIQEALAELESIDIARAAHVQLGFLARELRNHYSAVRVSGAGLETEDDPSKRLRWLELIEQAADGCIGTVKKMEPLIPDEHA